MVIIEVIKGKLRLQYDGRQYHPQYFDEGGTEYRNPKTGETGIREPKWQNSNSYYTSLPICIDHCAKRLIAFHLNNDEVITIKEYLRQLKEVSGEIKEAVNDVQ